MATIPKRPPGILEKPMRNPQGWLARKTRPLLREPTLHFFALGALLFAAHRLLAADPRTIVVSPVLRDDLTRRFRDQSGRWPTTTELDEALRTWKTDEALYREALRERLDREDAIVRTVLADKLRARAAAEFGKREPSDAELDRWLAEHRGLYETPLRYDCEYVVFPKSSAVADADRARFERAVQAGAKPATLGRAVFGNNLTREQLQEKFGPQLQERICSLPTGEWHRLETETDLLLWRVKSIDGGLPGREVLRPRLVYDWQSDMRRQTVEHAVDTIVARYRFVERSP
jgi:hypothetical protein